MHEEKKGKVGLSKRIGVKVRLELAGIYIYRMRIKGIEPGAEEIASRYLLTKENAEELLQTTPKAGKPFRVPNILRRNMGSDEEI